MGIVLERVCHQVFATDEAEDMLKKPNTYLKFFGSPLFKGVLAFKHLPQDLTGQVPQHLPQDLPELLLIIGKCQI